ncbi:MAG TPA: hypothetical protein VGT02_08150 [Methylomirabilota bacterium]|nr:hypothetical protein [Methylomirabilota bacterium]
MTRRIVLSLLAFAPALALGAGSAQAFNPQPEPPAREIFFQDGTRVLVDKNNRVFVFQRVKDGTYRTKSGETLTVVNGGIGKRPGEERAIPPKDPWHTFQDGTRAIIDDNHHVFTFQPARDGTYKMKDGKTITVLKGSLSAIPPKEPWKGTTGGTR